MGSIKVIIATRQPIFSQGIRAIFAENPGIALVGETNNGQETKQLCFAHQPDILLLDSFLAESDLCELVRQIKRRLPRLELIYFIEDENHLDFVALMHAGVKGYLLKDEALEPLIRALYAVNEGDLWLSVRIVDLLLQQAGGLPSSACARTSPFSNREFEILQYLAQGMRNQEIARELSITERTVRHHIERIMGKLGVANRTQAVVVAVQNQWISL